jgi:hypothetical protein
VRAGYVLVGLRKESFMADRPTSDAARASVQEASRKITSIKPVPKDETPTTGKGKNGAALQGETR